MRILLKIAMVLNTLWTVLVLLFFLGLIALGIWLQSKLIAGIGIFAIVYGLIRIGFFAHLSDVDGKKK